MTEGKGVHVIYSAEEIETIGQLYYLGKPLRDIWIKVNDQFHGGREVRNKGAIHRVLAKHFDNKKRTPVTQQKQYQWSGTE